MSHYNAALVREAREDADRIRTNIQRLDSQDGAEADDFRYTAAMFEKLADALEQQDTEVDAMAARIQAGDRSRDEVIEECAAMADAHHPPRLRSGIDPEAMDTINSERRGELIAADEIAVRLRRLKTKPLS